MKKKTLFVLFGFLFGLCGMFCFVNTPSAAQASSTSASVWDGNEVESQSGLGVNEWYYDGKYHIYTAAAFSYFSHYVNTNGNSFSGAEISLETDIDLAGHAWTPIGGSDHVFQGVFDGKGHYIFGLNIQTSSSHAGLFGKIGSNASIKNLNLRNVSFSGTAQYVGGIVGEVSSSNMISNCSVKGSLSATSNSGQFVGGIAGKVSSSSIQKCSADLSISSSCQDTSSCFGGIAGKIENVKVNYSSFAGSISSVAGYVGGLIGHASGTSSISNSFNVGNLDCKAQTSGNIGGLVGRAEGTFTIETAYNSGDLLIQSGATSALYASGLVGYVANGRTSLKNSLMLGQIKTSESVVLSNQASFLWQANVSARIDATDTYFDASNTDKDEQKKQYAVEGLYSLAKTRDFYRNGTYFSQNWYFSEEINSEGWKFGSENNCLPSFAFTAGRYTENGSDDLGNNDQDASADENFRGQGTAQSPFLIETAGDLARLSEMVNAGQLSAKYFSLQNDVNLIGRTWTPIGDNGKVFSGVFDGNGHTISGLSCSYQNKFAYHGLFGITSNAVIKNLTVGDFSLTTGRTTTGNIVASVTGNTYLVNCLDKNTINNSVGRASSGKLFVILGKNNKDDIAGTSVNSSMTTLKLSGISYSKGFDVAISGEGGNFYAAKTADGDKTTIENMVHALYFGEFNILLDESGRVLSQNIDNTFGKTVLPRLSTSLGTNDVLIKRGSKLQGYKLKNAAGNNKVWNILESGAGSWSGFSSINKQSLVDGLSAVWQEHAEQTIRVVYNAYEMANFGATANPSAPYVGANLTDKRGKPLQNYAGRNITISLSTRGDNAGQVYVDYALEYDSFLSESDYISDEPLFATGGANVQHLRGDDFDFVGIFEGSLDRSGKFDFKRDSDGELIEFKRGTVTFVNDSLQKTYYAQWESQNEEKYSTKIVFNTEDTGITDISKAVAEVKSLSYDGVTKLENGQDKLEENVVNDPTVDDGKLTYDIKYNTQFSDKIESYLKFNVSLNAGYRIVANGITFDEQPLDAWAYDSNFGKVTTARTDSKMTTGYSYYNSVQELTSQDSPSRIVNLEGLNNLEFYNLLGNHQISITIEKEKYEDRFEISDNEVFVGIGPNETVKITKNGEAYSSNLQLGVSIYDMKDLIEFVNQYKKDKDTEYDWSKLFEGESSTTELKITFDFVHNQILFSSGTYDAVEIDFSGFENAGIRFSIGGKEYKILKTTEDESGNSFVVTTIQNDSRGGLAEAIFSYNSTDPRESKLSYEAFNTFVIVASTEYANVEGDSLSFTAVGADNDYADPSAIKGESLKWFNDDQDAQTPTQTKYLMTFEDKPHTAGAGDKINVITKYIKASFSLSFVDKKSGEKIRTDSPTIVWDNGLDISTETSGTISFRIESSDRFRLFNDDELVLYSDGQSELYPSTEDSYNIKIEVDAKTILGLKEGDSNFVKDLNSANGMYFGRLLQPAGEQSIKLIDKGAKANLLEVGGYVFKNDGYEISLGYSSQLYAGRYSITIICTDQLYDVTYVTKFIEQNDSSNLESLVEDFKSPDKYNEDGSQVLTTGRFTTGEETKNDEGAEADNGNLSGLKFDDTLYLNSHVGENKGYVFYRWILQSEGINQILSQATLDGTFSQIYQDVTVGGDETKIVDQFKLYAFAVYQRKQATVSLAQSVQIEEENISFEEASNRGLSFDMADVTYDYFIDKDPQHATITMSGDNSNGYYLTGYQAIDSDGKELLSGTEKIYAEYDDEEDPSATTKAINIDLSWLKDAIANGKLVKDNTLKETFMLVPILKKKTATLVFHSGTGEGNEYGDGLSGHVFSTTNDETTGNEYTNSQTLKFGEAVSLSSLSPDGQDALIEDLFHHRTGYSLASNPWKWKTDGANGDLSLSYMQLIADMFDEGERSTANQPIQIHLYRVWDAHSYTVTFHSNTGTFKNNREYSQLTLSLTYDQVYDTAQMTTLLSAAKINPIEKTGYYLLGWFTEASDGTKIFDADGNVVEGTYFNDGKFVYAGAFDVYAQWDANTYEIKILFNKADKVVGQTDGVESATYSLEYDSNFSALEIAQDLNGIDSFSEQNVTRAGFLFDGIYAFGNGTKTLISNNFVFNTTFPTFEFPSMGNLAVTLYVGWRFDTTYFSLAVRNSLPALTYNGDPDGQDVQLANYFAQGNFTATGFLIDTSAEGQLISLSKEVKSISLVTLLTSTSDAIINPGQKSFKVKNVGAYSVQLVLTLTDNKTGNQILDDNFNRGQLQEIQLNFAIEVESAGLDLKDEFSDGLYLQNLKRLVGIYLSNTSEEKSLRQQLYDAGTLSDAINVLKTFDNSVPEKTGEEDIKQYNQKIYQYFMTRFYLLSHTSESSYQNVQKSKTYYKDWTFGDFENFKQSEAETFAQILERILFFGFYDFENLTPNYVLEGYSADGEGENYSFYVELLAEETFEPKELRISRIEIATGYSTLSAGNKYSLRVYVTGSDEALGNYELSTTPEGEHYFVASIQGYIFPQIISLENASKEKQVYFSRQFEDGRIVPWATSFASQEIDGREYFALGEDASIFVYVQIQTSSIGAYDEDTTFRYTDAQNFLYFTEVSVLAKSGDSYYNITGNFKFVLDDDAYFIIRSTKGVANVRVTATYLTRDFGSMIFQNLPEGISTSVLSITEVEYEGGKEISSDLQNGHVVEKDGEILFEIVSNKANQVEIFVGNRVQKITFAVESLNLNQFMSLYTWSSDSVTEISGVMSTKNSYSITKEEISEKSQNATDEVAQIDYFAIYTDLVKATYEYNFPKGYQVQTTQTTTLKLGQKVTDEILPYVSGLGTASSLRVKNEDGTTADYTELNNFGPEENRVFGGWNNRTDTAGNEYRFTPVTFEVKWTVPDEIEYEAIQGPIVMAVYTYSSFSVNDFINLFSANEDIFDYSYSWKINYADETSETSSEQIINLRDQGGTTASGTYELTVTRSVKKMLVDAHTFEGPTDKSVTISVEITFMPYKLTEVSTPQEATAEYDGTDHKNDDNFFVNVKYVAFNNETQAYDEEPTETQVKYAETGLFTFSIILDGNPTTDMVNAGEYQVTMNLLDKMFTLEEGLSESEIKFTYTVTPFTFALDGLVEDFQKQFNLDDPLMQQTLEVLDGNFVTVQYARHDKDEDVGKKDIYFEDVLTEFKRNVNFTFGEKDVFKDGQKVVGAPAIGTLNIVASGTLQIDLVGDTLVNNKVSAEYNGQEYKLSVKEFKLLIQNILADDISLDLSLYDATKGETLDEKDNLKYLKDKMASLVANFYLSNVVSAKDAGVYSFNFNVAGTALEKYYSNVTIENVYKFEITPFVIKLEGLELDKVYDGLLTNRIDVPGHEEIQIEATYASRFVSDYVSVTLAVVPKDETTTVNAANFVPEVRTTHAKITKLTATLTLELVGDSDGKYEYGAISENTLANNFKIQKIESELGTVQEEDAINSLLYAGRYKMSYVLTTKEKRTNARGFLFAGEYSVKTSNDEGVQIQASFEDFEMTIQTLSFEITPKQINLNIDGPIATITDQDNFTSFEYSYTVAETGDTLVLKLGVDQHAGGTLSVGPHALKILDESYASEIGNSIVVTITPEDNEGLNVVQKSGTVFLKIEEELKSKEYDGTTYSITVSDHSFTITNGSGNQETYQISATLNDEAFEDEYEITSITFDKTARNAGTYRLMLQASAHAYSFVFETEYVFEITPKTINADSLSKLFEKSYDGSALTGQKKLTAELGCVGEDEVFVSGRFDTADASDLPKRLTLNQPSGQQGLNYQFDKTETTSKITPAEATISISDTQYVYGTLNKDNLLSGLRVSVTTNGETLLQSLYKLEISSSNIDEANDYSSRGFLKVKDGGYSITIGPEESTSSNYQIKSLTTQITITPFELRLTFTQIIKTVEYGSTEWAGLVANGGKFEYVLPAADNELAETVKLELTIDEFSQEVNKYRVSSKDFKSLDKDYDLKSVEDISPDGAFEIIKQRQYLYVLIDNKEASTDNERIAVSTSYDGKEYDTVKLQQKGGEWWLILSNSTTGAQKDLAKLAFFTYVDGEYVEYLGEVIGLQAEFSLPQNVKVNLATSTPIEIYASNASSQSNQVKFGLYSYQRYTYLLTVEKQKLMFRTGTNLTTPFNNKEAVLNFEDAAEILTGIVEGESLSLSVKLLDSEGKGAKYYSPNPYEIACELSGETASQYEIVLQYENGGNVQGHIDRAEIAIYINSKAMIYGEREIARGDVTDYFVLGTDYRFDFGELGDFDLKAYLAQGRKFEPIIEILFEEDSDLSSSKYLKVGPYTANLSIRALDETDFRLRYVYVDNILQDAESTTDIVLTVVKKTLTLSQKQGGETLQEIFTRDYDDELGTTAEIFVNKNDNSLANLRFTLDGIVEGDVVKLVSAQFSRERGTGPMIFNFDETCADCANYEIAQVMGTINPVKIALEFEFDKDNVSTDLVGKMIEALAYPLVDDGYLTANSFDPTTNTRGNFPNSLSGYVGHEFTYWSLDLALSGDTEIHKKQIDALTALKNDGIAINEELSESLMSVSIPVGNDGNTVKLLRELLKNDTFGMHYKDQGTKVVFHANWEAQKFSLTIRITDEEGNSTSIMGKVNSDSFAGDVTDSRKIDDLFTFEDGKSVTLKAYANLHASFAAFSLGLIEIEDGEVPDYAKFAVGQEEDYYYLTISEVVNNLEIVVKFRPQKVKISLDVTGEIKENLHAEGNLFDEDFVWETNFFNVKDFTYLNLPALTIVGRTLKGYEVDGKEILLDDFSKTKLIDESLTDDITLVLKPLFDAKKIKVTLDYGYDGQKQDVFVDYGSAYSTAYYDDLDKTPAWADVKNPTRAGNKFLGWFLDGRVIDETELVKPTSEEITLLAGWEMIKYDISITLENVRQNLEGASSTLLLQGDKIVSSEGAFYGQEFFVKLSPKAGYVWPEKESEQWDPRFDVEFDDSGTATIKFTVGAEDFVASIVAIARENQIEFSGENIDEVSVTNVTDQQAITEIQNEDGVYSFGLYTGKVVKFEVKATAGYEVLQNAIFKDQTGKVLEASALENQGIVVSSQIDENGILILEISGITESLEIVFQTKVRENEISIEFENVDTIERIAIVTETGEEEQRKDEAIIVQIATGKELTFFVDFAHGYDFKDILVSDAFGTTRLVAESSKISETRYKFVLKNIVSDGQVTIQAMTRKYEITLNVTSYNLANEKVQVDGNTLTVLSGTEHVTTLTVDFGTRIGLEVSHAASYNFSGWNITDGEVALGEREQREAGFELVEGAWTYLVTDNASIWAIFSQYTYSIALKTFDYAKVDPRFSNIENPFVEIEGKYFDEDGNELTNFEINYGQSKKIKVEIPEGYVFGGFGIFDEDGTWRFIDDEERSGEDVEVTILPTQFGNSKVDTIYMIVISKTSIIKVQGRISYGNESEQDFDVGGIELSDQQGNSANAFGYVSGSRIHYFEEDFENGKVKDQFNFRFVANIQKSPRDDIFLKVSQPRDGYAFDRIEVINGNADYEIAYQTEAFIVFKFDALVTAYFEDLQIAVYYAPDLNVVDLSFVLNAEEVSGGAIEIESPQSDIKKLWTSGNGYSKVSVSAYTDVKFAVSVYIRAGYYVDQNSLAESVDDPQHIIEEGSLRFEAQSIENTGFSGKITFNVMGFVGTSSIKIKIIGEKYVVVFKDGTEILAKVHNVEFGTSLDNYLLQSNSENIETFDLSFANGRLDLVRSMQDFHFEGYFTYQNGAGKHYVNSDGRAVGLWLENGYAYNLSTGKYELEKNAAINSDGEIEVSLYLYMSYFKTRIHFEMIPDVSVNFSAKQIVSGVDETNSWFYEINPNYIEIAFNTDIYITAPELNGYKFYRFVISQRNFDGDWLTPVVFYQERMPWSTNEVDKIVECKIEIVYFAEMNVQIVGGEGKATLAPVVPEDYADEQSLELLAQGYFDTTKELKIIAEPDKGFSFVRWEYLGETSRDNEFVLSASRRATIYLYLQGNVVTLDFSDERYDTTYGQIIRLDILKMTGEEQHIGNMVTLLSGGKYKKNKTQVEVAVGDVVTFVVSTAEDMAVEWNRDDISFKEYRAGLMYFEMRVGYVEGENPKLTIIPYFTNAHRSVYISSVFTAEDMLERALDENNVDLALTIMVGGEKGNIFTFDRGETIEIQLQTFARYKVAGIKIRSLGENFTNMEEFFLDNKIVLNEDFMSSHNFGGNIYIQVEVTRLMWEDVEIETDSFRGAGTSKNPYHITNQEELLLFMHLVNSGAVNSRGQEYRTCAYVLDNDMSLEQRFWTPVGTTQHSFDGSFNFNNHVVKEIGLAINYDQISFGGFFGVLGENARISRGSPSWWWILLIVILILMLILLFVSLIYHNKKKEKEQDELAKH